MIGKNIQYQFYKRWKRATSVSTSRQIFSAIITIGGITFIAKLVALGKDVIVARSFGTNDSLEAFLTAFLLPNFLVSVIGSAFSAAFIPIYIETRENEGKIAAKQLLSGVVLWTTVLLVVISIGLGFIGPAVLSRLASHFDLAKLLLTRQLFYLVLPVIILSGLSSLLSAVLNANEKFALAAATPTIIPLVSIIALLVGVHPISAYLLAVSLPVAFFFQLCVLCYCLYKAGITISVIGAASHPAIRRVLNQYIPMAAGSIIMSSNLLIDQSMAVTLGPHSIATLNYGNKIIALVTSIGSVAIGTAVLPYFSKMVAGNQWNSIRRTLRTYTRLIIFITIPCTLMLMVLSRFIIKLFFQHGAFTVADTNMVAAVQIMYLIQIPFYTIGILYVRLISSLKANYVIMWGAVLSCTMNLVLDYGLMHVMGVAGIALSTSIVYITSFVYISIMLRRTMDRMQSKEQVCASH